MEKNVALIGCGRIAGHHCKSIAAIDGIRVAAVCDLELSKASIYSREFDVPAFNNYHEMFKKVPDIDIAAIITPSGMHYEHATDVIQRYKKHVIIEKPTFMRLNQVAKAYEIAKTANKRIFPVFQNRYNKAVVRLRRAFDNGELGEVRLVSVRLRWCRPERYYNLAPWRGTFSHDGGALTNQTIHHIDLLRHLGGEVEKVNATMRTLGARIEVEDSVVATAIYKSGALGTIEATTAARPDDFEASISFVCAKGLAQIGGIAVNELQVFTPEPTACQINSEDFSRIKNHGAVYGFGHTGMYQDIVADLNGEIGFPLDRKDCIKTLGLLHAFYRSDETNSWVNVDDQMESSRLGTENGEISNLYRTPEPK
ncbi:MAG: putative 4,5-dihydroxyphthalate dehydrogenase [Alphaproteobacteria bacterium MarineAlpha3_Bin5]|nr:dehydrogenase [Magnetovibrio sp.]PPR79818.1 MAG: putative 4,5-dihydroxyphthalate dehydrogenase [Alphaproteobacteria bacterium MarineAlpha3_Bin5]